jgi:hypothetical protein
LGTDASFCDVLCLSRERAGAGASTSVVISRIGAGANLGEMIGSTRGAVPRARSTSLARK